jgi:FkbM family methyltransferase
MIKSLVSIIKFVTQHPLNDNRRLMALANFFVWQLKMRILGGKFVVNWVDKARFIVKRGETGLTGNMYCGLMEYQDMAFALHYLRDSDEFYDIGANVGAYTILASAVVGCRSHVFEPLPNTFERLNEQIAINRMEELVFAHNIGIGSKADTLEFTNYLNCMNHVNTDPTITDVTKVAVASLDELYNPELNSLVKIDVEGYENFVFEGGEIFFSNLNVSGLIVELNGSGKQFNISDADIDSRIRDFGFFPIAYNPVSREVTLLHSFNTEGNTIYVKDITTVRERCRTANKVLVHTAAKYQL